MHDPYLAALPVLVWLFFCFVVGRFAVTFHRSSGVWFLVALLLSPLGAVIALYLAGDAEGDPVQREKEERIRRNHPHRKDVQEAILNEMNCPHCAAAVNPVTGDGLHSSEEEPWLLFCNRCQEAVEPDD